MFPLLSLLPSWSVVIPLVVFSVLPPCCCVFLFSAVLDFWLLKNIHPGCTFSSVFVWIKDSIIYTPWLSSSCIWVVSSWTLTVWEELAKPSVTLPKGFLQSASEASFSMLQMGRTSRTGFCSPIVIYSNLADNLFSSTMLNNITLHNFDQICPNILISSIDPERSETSDARAERRPSRSNWSADIHPRPEALLLWRRCQLMSHGVIVCRSQHTSASVGPEMIRCGSPGSFTRLPMRICSGTSHFKCWFSEMKCRHACHSHSSTIHLLLH